MRSKATTSAWRGWHDADSQRSGVGGLRCRDCERRRQYHRRNRARRERHRGEPTTSVCWHGRHRHDHPRHIGVNPSATWLRSLPGINVSEASGTIIGAPTDTVGGNVISSSEKASSCLAPVYTFGKHDRNVGERHASSATRRYLRQARGGTSIGGAATDRTLSAISRAFTSSQRPARSPPTTRSSTTRSELRPMASRTTEHARHPAAGQPADRLISGSPARLSITSNTIA